MAALATALQQGLGALSLTLTEAQQQQLLDYLALLQRWNRTYNLTAVRDAQQMLTRHVLDSLSVLPHLPPGALLDVGAGAGLPGIVLAIADPQRTVTVLDSNGKKTRFMFQCVTELGLARCAVVKARVQDYRPAQRPQLVISRAFASLSDMLDTCAHLPANGGLLLAMKGQYPAEELQCIAERAQLVAVQALKVPGLAEERCLVTLRPLAAPA